MNSSIEFQMTLDPSTFSRIQCLRLCAKKYAERNHQCDGDVSITALFLHTLDNNYILIKLKIDGYRYNVNRSIFTSVACNRYQSEGYVDTMQSISFDLRRVRLTSGAHNGIGFVCIVKSHCDSYFNEGDL